MMRIRSRKSSTIAPFFAAVTQHVIATWVAANTLLFAFNRIRKVPTIRSRIVFPGRFLFVVKFFAHDFLAFLVGFNSRFNTPQIRLTYCVPRWQRSVRYRRVASGVGLPPHATDIALAVIPRDSARAMIACRIVSGVSFIPKLYRTCVRIASKKSKIILG